MGVTDIHCHVIANEFVKELNQSHAGITVGEYQASTGRRYFHDEKSGMTVNYTSRNHYDMGSRLRDMNRFGIDVQAVSLALPSIDRLEGEKATRLAKVANDTTHDLCSVDPDRFQALGILPFQNPDDALEEADRCTGSLGFRGFIVASNVRGEALDSPRFLPIFERLSKLRAVLLLHPTIPIASNISQEYALDLTFGWPFDTTMAMARLVYGGVMARFDGLRFVAVHSGGMVPFYRGRISYVQKQYEKDTQTESKHPPLYYFRRFYMDTAAFDSDALKCVFSFVGRNGMVFGTDYPFGAEGGRLVVKQAIRGVRGMRLARRDQELIFGGNPRRLLTRVANP